MEALLKNPYPIVLNIVDAILSHHLRGHPFSTYSTFSEKLAFLTLMNTKVTFKGTVMQIEKALINNRLRVLKLS